MALRRDMENRKPPPPKAERAPGKYLVAHACFECRKSFKIAPRTERTPVCANCGGQLHEMGRSFKAPPAKNLEQWQKVQVLYNAGFRFFSYRSFSCPALPAKLSEVEAFIHANPQHPMRVAAPNSSFKADGYAAA